MFYDRGGNCMKKQKYMYLYTSEVGKGFSVEYKYFTFSLIKIWYANYTETEPYHQEYACVSDFYEVRFVLKGQSKFSLGDGSCLSAVAGDFVIFPPGIKYRVLHEDSCFSKFGFAYTLRLKENSSRVGYYLINEQLRNVQVYKYSSNATILIDQMLQLYKSASFDYEATIGFLVLSLFMDLMGTVAADINKAKTIRETRVQKAVDFINDTLTSDTNTKQVAAHVKLSVKQLNRLFLAELGETVSTVIDGAKRKRIRGLLMNPQLSLDEIARIMSYNDTAVFVRAFKRAEGITPKQFREVMKVGHIHTVEKF